MPFEILTPTAAKLSTVTPRVEKHGEDNVSAITIGLSITGPNTILDHLDGGKLRNALYMAVPDQEQLPGVEPSDGYLPAGGEPTQPAMAAFDAAVAEVGVRNVLLASDLRGAFVRHLAATLQPPAAQQGDLCQNCAPDGRCMKRQALCGVKLAAQQGEASNLWKQGHGHVVPRADGVKARCGGPALCKVCQAEQAALEKAQQGEAVAPDGDDADSPTIRGCIGAIKQAHDESLEGEHASARVMLRDVVADLEQIAAQPAAAPQPVAHGDANPMTAHRAAWFLERFKREEKLLGPNERKALLFAIDALERLAAAPAGVVGEPAWHVRVCDNGREVLWGGNIPADERAHIEGLGDKLVPVYTAPPARQALAPDQISEMEWGAACIGLGWDVRVSAVRAVERAHGIGGKGETA